MKGKLKFIIPVPILLIVAAAAAYMLVLAPKPAKAKPPKVDGTLFTLTNDFVINLSGGHYAKLGVALLLSSPPPASADGTTTLPQEAAVRATITNDLTGVTPTKLINRSSRAALLTELLADLKHSTDEPITKVLITDLAVQ
jgi:flagellar FliL protein